MVTGDPVYGSHGRNRVRCVLLATRTYWQLRLAIGKYALVLVALPHVTPSACASGDAGARQRGRHVVSPASRRTCGRLVRAECPRRFERRSARCAVSTDQRSSSRASLRRAGSTCTGTGHPDPRPIAGQRCDQCRECRGRDPVSAQSAGRQHEPDRRRRRCITAAAEPRAVQPPRRSRRNG
jgi:hypothetical protein